MYDNGKRRVSPQGWRATRRLSRKNLIVPNARRGRLGREPVRGYQRNWCLHLTQLEEVRHYLSLVESLVEKGPGSGPRQSNLITGALREDTQYSGDTFGSYGVRTAEKTPKLPGRLAFYQSIVALSKPPHSMSFFRRNL